VTFTGVLLYGTGSVSQGQQDSGVCFGLFSCVSSVCRRLTGRWMCVVFLPKVRELQLTTHHAAPTGLPPAPSSTFPSALISEPLEGYQYRSVGHSKSYQDREVERAREW